MGASFVLGFEGLPPTYVAYVHSSVRRCRLNWPAGPFPHPKLPGAPTYNPKGLVKATYFYSFGYLCFTGDFDGSPKKFLRPKKFMDLRCPPGGLAKRPSEDHDHRSKDCPTHPGQTVIWAWIPIGWGRGAVLQQTACGSQSPVATLLTSLGSSTVASTVASS